MLRAVFCVCVLVSLAEGANLKFRPLSALKHVFGAQSPWYHLVEPSKREEESTKPDFCNGLDCPGFTVVKDFKDKFQIRKYDSTMWVSTNIVGPTFESAESTCFHRLFDYIEGKNVEKRKVAMTAPVITRIIPGQGPACASNFTVSFYVSQKGKMAPPKPSDPSVVFQKFPALTVYVRSFGGYYMEGFKPWYDEAVKLGQFLRNASLPFRDDYFYIGGYDSPFKIFNRHNEVWFFPKQ